MTNTTRFILRVNLPGVAPYEIGPEIWQVSIADAIGDGADAIAYAATAELLDEPTPAGAKRLRDRVIEEMTAALAAAGDTYTAPEGVGYELIERVSTLDREDGGDTLATVEQAPPDPVVEQVIAFEDLPLGSSASRRAIVRFSDGTEGQALAWYGDEILVCEGDLIGKTLKQLRSLHFHRDRDRLQS